MKKTFKLKALVLFVAVIMALTIVPNVRANEKQDLIDSAKYTNITGYSKNSAASNVEVTATATRDGAAVEDLGNLKAGDVITVKFSMSKLPGAGLWDFSWKIGWLDANLEIVRTDLNEPGEEVDEGLKDVPYINPLAVGQKVNLQNDYFVSEDEVIHDAEKDAGVKYVSIGATASSRAATTAGDIFELQFVVKEGAYVGLTDDILSCDTDITEAVLKMFAALPDIDDKQVVTIFYGKGITEEDALAIGDALMEKYPLLEFGYINGKMDVYSYMFAIE